MNPERYLLTHSQLMIDDEELDIHVQMPWELPALPDNLLETNKLNDQLMIESDSSGNREAAYLISDNKRHGACRLFYPDGTIKAEMFYDRGILHGPSIFFSPNKSILTETWYIQGKKTGKVKYFYLSGQLASLQRFREGVWDGPQEYWYEDSTLKSYLPYQQGALHGEVRLFWENHNLKRSCHYFKGLREGWDRLWNEKGILIDEGEFYQGKPTGPHRHFFFEGQLQEECHYHTPIRFDRKEWDIEGALIYEGVYASDLTYTEHRVLDGQKMQLKKGYWDGQRLCWK